MGTCSSRSAAAPAARPSASGKGATAAGKARWPRNAALDDESKAEPVMNAQTGEVRAVSERARARARRRGGKQTAPRASVARARKRARAADAFRAPPSERYARARRPLARAPRAVALARSPQIEDPADAEGDDEYEYEAASDEEAEDAELADADDVQASARSAREREEGTRRRRRRRVSLPLSRARPPRAQGARAVGAGGDDARDPRLGARERLARQEVAAGRAARAARDTRRVHTRGGRANWSTLAGGPRRSSPRAGDRCRRT